MTNNQAPGTTSPAPYGGARRGAGAPKGNLNAYKTGLRSRRFHQLRAALPLEARIAFDRAITNAVAIARDERDPAGLSKRAAHAHRQRRIASAPVPIVAAAAAAWSLPASSSAEQVANLLRALRPWLASDLSYDEQSSSDNERHRDSAKFLDGDRPHRPRGSRSSSSDDEPPGGISTVPNDGDPRPSSPGGNATAALPSTPSRAASRTSRRGAPLDLRAGARPRRRRTDAEMRRSTLQRPPLRRPSARLERVMARVVQPPAMPTFLRALTLLSRGKAPGPRLWHRLTTAQRAIVAATVAELELVPLPAAPPRLDLFPEWPRQLSPGRREPALRPTSPRDTRRFAVPDHPIALGPAGASARRAAHVAAGRAGAAARETSRLARGAQAAGR